MTSLVLGDGDLMVSNPGMIPALRREGETKQVTNESDKFRRVNDMKEIKRWRYNRKWLGSSILRQSGQGGSF